MIHLRWTIFHMNLFNRTHIQIHFTQSNSLWSTKDLITKLICSYHLKNEASFKNELKQLSLPAFLNRIRIFWQTTQRQQREFEIFKLVHFATSGCLCLLLINANTGFPSSFRLKKKLYFQSVEGGGETIFVK